MHTILLVESDPLSRRVLDVCLRKAGFAVTTASDGTDALARLGLEVPDAVVTATRLRELDGFALVETLRDRPGAADVPAVFITSSPSDDERARAGELGVEDYLVRPVYVRELILRLQLLVSRRVQRAVLTRAMDQMDGVAVAPVVQEQEIGADAMVRERSLAPVTREAEPSIASEPAADLVVAGVPRANRTGRRVAFVAAAACSVLLVAAGLPSMRSRQLREAELARSGATPPVAAAAAVAVGDRQPEVPLAPQDVASEAPIAETPAPAPATDESPAPAAADAVGGAIPAPLAEAPARDPRETALDVSIRLHSRSALVRDAQRALLKGDTARAISLALKAVAANAADADAWLTLAAARKAAGDLAGAREAYSRCIASAHTFGVTSCRALASASEDRQLASPVKTAPVPVSEF